MACTGHVQLQFGRGGEAAETDHILTLEYQGYLNFNSAAAVKPRRRYLKGTGRAPQMHFNSAAAVKPRRRITIQRRGGRQIELQFGRGGEAAETLTRASRGKPGTLYFNSAAAVKPRSR